MNIRLIAVFQLHSRKTDAHLTFFTDRHHPQHEVVALSLEYIHYDASNWRYSIIKCARMTDYGMHAHVICHLSAAHPHSYISYLIPKFFITLTCYYVQSFVVIWFGRWNFPRKMKWDFHMWLICNNKWRNCQPPLHHWQAVSDTFFVFFFLLPARWLIVTPSVANYTLDIISSCRVLAAFSRTLCICWCDTSPPQTAGTANM